MTRPRTPKWIGTIAADGKKRCREEGKRRRAAIPAEHRTVLDARIREGVRTLIRSRGARLVMSYASMGTEPFLLPLEKMCPGVQFCYPCCDRVGGMTVRLSDGSSWGKDAYGIDVPNGPETDPSSIDLVLVPCTAFDAEGRRVGMGRGYYDRFLPGCMSAFRALTAYECQRFEQVPSEESDALMDAIVTEDRVRFPGR